MNHVSCIMYHESCILYHGGGSSLTEEERQACPLTIRRQLELATWQLPNQVDTPALAFNNSPHQ